MITHNIDITDRQKQSKAPFSYESTLKLPDGTMFSGVFPGGFISVKIYVDEKVSIPVRMDCLTADKKVLFRDRNGNTVAYWQLYEDTEQLPYVSSVLLNDNGIISGHVVCTPETVNVLCGVMRDLTQNLYLDADAFILIPQCHVATLRGSSRSFGFRHDGQLEIRTSDIELLPAPSLEPGDGAVWRKTIDASNLSFNLKNTSAWDAANTTPDSVSQVIVNGSTYWTGNTSLLLKAGVQSNLRLVQQKKTITLRGVADV